MEAALASISFDSIENEFKLLFVLVVLDVEFVLLVALLLEVVV